MAAGRYKGDRMAARRILKQEEVRETVRRATVRVAENARRNIGPGDFAGSLRVVIFKDRTRWIGRVVTDDPGFVVIEFGGRRQAAKAPLRKALRSTSGVTPGKPGRAR